MISAKARKNFTLLQAVPPLLSGCWAAAALKGREQHLFHFKLFGSFSTTFCRWFGFVYSFFVEGAGVATSNEDSKKDTRKEFKLSSKDGWCYYATTTRRPLEVRETAVLNKNEVPPYRLLGVSYPFVSLL